MTLRDADLKVGDVVEIERTVEVVRITDTHVWTADGICYGLDKGYFRVTGITRKAEPEYPEYWPPQLYDVWQCGGSYYSVHEGGKGNLYLLPRFASIRFEPDEFLSDIGWPELVFRAGESLSLEKQNAIIDELNETSSAIVSLRDEFAAVRSAAMTADDENKRLFNRIKNRRYRLRYADGSKSDWTPISGSLNSHYFNQFDNRRIVGMDYIDEPPD